MKKVENLLYRLLNISIPTLLLIGAYESIKGDHIGQIASIMLAILCQLIVMECKMK